MRWLIYKIIIKTINNWKMNKIMCIYWTLACPHREIDTSLHNCTLLKINQPTSNKRKQINETKSKSRYVHMYKGDQMK